MKTREAIAARGGAREVGRAVSSPVGLAGRIRAARKLTHQIRWPGTDIEIGIRVLSRKELAAAQAAAAAAVKALGIDESKLTAEQADRVGAEYAIQILWRALHDSTAPDASPLFETAEQLDAEGTVDEVHALLDEYESLRQSVDPTLGEIPEGQWTAFLDAVKKKDETRSRGIASSMPRPWLLSTVARLASSLSLSWSSTALFSTPLSENEAENDGQDGGQAESSSE